MVLLVKRCLEKEKAVRPTARDLLSAEPLSAWLPQLPPATAPATPLPSTAGSAAVTPTALAATTGTAGGLLAATTNVAAVPASAAAAPAPPPAAVASPCSALAATSDTLAPPLSLGGARPPASSVVESPVATPQRQYDVTVAMVPAGLRNFYQWRTHAGQYGGSGATDPMWQHIDALQGHEVVAMATSRHVCVVLGANGEVFSWMTPGADCDVRAPSPACHSGLGASWGGGTRAHGQMRPVRPTQKPHAHARAPASARATLERARLVFAPKRSLGSVARDTLDRSCRLRARCGPRP